jgi:hypothetical protein
MSDSKRAVSEQAALRPVIAGTASQTGTEFFRALVKNLAATIYESLTKRHSGLTPGYGCLARRLAEAETA